MERGWPAPCASAPLDARVDVPGSKSVTNRMLVLAALADEPTVVRRPLRARDTELMAAGLRALGTGVADGPGGDWRITPGPLHGPATVDCGLSGTVMRFLPPVAALACGTVRFDGDEAARARPMTPLVAALRDLGARITTDGDAGLPLTVSGTGSLRGGCVTIDASASSQFISGLLLAGARFDEGVEVRSGGSRVPSAPHLAMTLSMLADVAVDAAEPEPGVWRVRPGRIRGGDRRVEPDTSSAAPFLAAAVVTGGRVRVPAWPWSSPQPGCRLPHLLQRMGASYAAEGDDLTLRGTGRISGVDLDLGDVSELTPVIVALAALAESPSRLWGIAHVRGHETDRLAALATEINGLGGWVTELPDGLEIRPRPLHGGRFRTYDDHRLAMAAAVLGLAVPGIVIENIETTTKTLPGFPAMWLRMLGAAS